MTKEQKAQLLLRAVELLNEADALVQEALGDSDVTWDTHEAIQNIADELCIDAAELTA